MFSSNNWPRASALSVFMIVCVVMPLAWYNQYLARKVEQERLG
jgi:putrescine transport system permease protein